MLYNENFIHTGAKFPPVCEISRLKKYAENRLLFNGNTEQVLRSYKERITNIITKFTDVPITFKSDINYFKLLTLKTGDLVCGEPITLSTDDSKKDMLDEFKNYVDFDGKLLESVYDVSRLGESIIRICEDENRKGNIIVCNPDMWFPVCNRENIRDIKVHIIAWIDETEINGKAVKILKVQKHYKGYYIKETYVINNSERVTEVMPDGENISYECYTVGPKIAESGKDKIDTGLSDFAIVQLTGTTMPDDIHGIDDYDAITSLVAELEVRYALESVILDKHTAPTMYANERAFTVDRITGEFSVNTGGVIPVGADENPPGYITWDASLQANHYMIEQLEKKINSLSEMGAVIDDSAFGNSQGYEALEIRMTNARLKARRLTNKLTKPVKKIIELLSELWGDKIEAKDVSIFWNDGIPNSEFRESSIANLKSSFFSNGTILKQHFGLSEEEAAEEVEKKQDENIDSLGGGFGLGVNIPRDTMSNENDE